MIRAVLVLAGLAGAPALAGEYVPPPGCTGYVTVQKRSCEVANYYRCTGDAPGEQRYAVFDEAGMSYLGKVDAEFQWLESWHRGDGMTARLEPSPRDPASFGTLMATGEDWYDFEQRYENGLRVRFQGFDRLTGGTVVIDGVALQATTFEYVGSIAGQDRDFVRSGSEFIHPEWRVFLSGKVIARDGGDAVHSDKTPVTFTFPGEPGFFTDQPQYGCGDQIAMGAHP